MVTAIFLGHSFGYSGIWKLEGLLSDLKEGQGKPSTLWLTPPPTLTQVASEAKPLRVILSNFGSVSETPKFLQSVQCRV